MTVQSLEDRIAKLPQWARDHIDALERERDFAVRRWRSIADQQTERPTWVEVLGDKGIDRLYVDAMSLHCVSGNIHVEIRPESKGRSHEPNSVSVRFDCAGRCGKAAILPQASNAIVIVETKE